MKLIFLKITTQSLLLVLLCSGFCSVYGQKQNSPQQIYTITDGLPVLKYRNSASVHEYYPVELFLEVDHPPMFFTDRPSCDLNRLQRNFIRHIDRFIRKNINKKMLKERGAYPTEEHVVNVTLRIDQAGKLTHVIAEGFHEALEQEVNRVIWNLPAMIPAKHNGKLVNVVYNTFVKFKN